MDTIFKTIAGQANLPEQLIPTGLDYYRRLAAKNAGLGMSSNLQCAICLHLAAEKQGHSVDTKTISRLSGAKSKSYYLDKLNNSKSILGFNEQKGFLSIQEICVQMSSPSLVIVTKDALQSYHDHLLKTFGEDRAKSVNLKKEMYVCSAYYAAAKHSKVKVDIQKLVELAKTKKKEVIELGDEMLKLMQKTAATNADTPSKQNHVRSNLLPLLQEEPDAKKPKSSTSATNYVDEYDQSDEDFLAWKQSILQKAVDGGFTQYAQYLTPTAS